MILAEADLSTFLAVLVKLRFIFWLRFDWSLRRTPKWMISRKPVG